jgi:hypothetical protein
VEGGGDGHVEILWRYRVSYRAGPREREEGGRIGYSLLQLLKVFELIDGRESTSITQYTVHLTNDYYVTI